MLKFIEVVQESLGYDIDTESCKSFSFLREVYVNPDYIIKMRENTLLKRRVEEDSLVEGMDKNLSFTELTIYTSPRATNTINVVGAPVELLEKYRRR